MTAQLITEARLQAIDADGNPVSGAKMYVYDAGTTTARTTYSDDAMSSANTNPVVADASGRFGPMYVNPTGGDIKLTLKTSADVLIYTQDDVGVQPTAVDPYYAISTEETAAGLTESLLTTKYPEGDIRRYGAVLDGATDDSVAAGRWLDAGQQGTELTHPGGTALLSGWSQKSITGDIRIRGPRSAIIKGTTSLTFLKPEGGDIDIEGISFSTWSNVIENDAADSGTTARLRVVDCAFSSVSLYCIYMQRPIDKARIKDCDFSSLSTGAILIGNSTYANQNDWGNIHITGNSCISVANSSSGNAHFALVIGRYARITENHINGVTSVDGEAWGIYTKIRYGVVENNIINGVKSTNSVTGGIQVKGTARGTSTTTNGYAVSVMNNTVIGDGGTAGIGLFCGDVKAVGNTVEGYTVGIVGTTDAGNANVSHNNIIGAAKTSGNYGINWNSSGDDVVIDRNTIRNTYNGIRVAPATADNFSICGNVINDSGNAAINLDATTLLSNVSVKGNVVDTATAFIFYDYCANLHIKNNVWSGLTNDPENAIDSEAATSFPVFISGNQPIKATTTSASATDIFYFYIPDDKLVLIEGTVLAIENGDANQAAYRVSGLFHAGSSTAAQLGSTSALFTAIESESAWDVTLGVTSDIARIRVTGEAATTIRWACDVKVTCVE